jgi:hypothetical protein
VSVGGQQRQHPPPLVSHASDPALATSLSLISTNPSSPSASTSTLQPLLAQLLTTSKYLEFVYWQGIEFFVNVTIFRKELVCNVVLEFVVQGAL